MRILFITATIPYPIISGAPLRTYNLLRHLAGKHDVYLVAFVETAEQRQGIAHLRQFCRAVETVDLPDDHALNRPLEGVHYLFRGIPPDLRFIRSEGMAQIIRRLATDVIFDVVQIEHTSMGVFLDILPAELRRRAVWMVHDIDFSRYARMAHVETRWRRKLRLWLHGRLLRKWEPGVAARFRRTIVVSESDRNILLAAEPNIQVEVVPNGVDTMLLEALLQESVKLRLRSDVPFGAFLSGGIDSSLVVALMSKLLQEPVKTFSVGYRGDGEVFSELPFARIVAERYQSDHHEVLVGAQDFVDLAEKVIWHMDQPIADMAAIATYMLSRKAAQQVKMVLTGEGGDELFAGYARYAGERLAPLFRLLPQAAKQAMLATAARVPRLRRPRLALYALCQPDEVSRLTNWFPLFNRDVKAALLSPAVVASLNGARTDEVFAAHLARTDARDSLSRMLYVDTKLWLPDDLLARGDKTSMAASLEARVPLLDHKLVEFAASLPPNMKLRGLTRKYLLKKVAGRYLPAEIIQRKKQGFPMPFSLWVRSDARTFVRDILSPATIRERGLFQPAQVELLLQQHENGSADHGIQIWALLNIELWYRLFIDSKTQPAMKTTTEKATMLQ